MGACPSEACALSEVWPGQCLLCCGLWAPGRQRVSGHVGQHAKEAAWGRAPRRRCTDAHGCYACPERGHMCVCLSAGTGGTTVRPGGMTGRPGGTTSRPGGMTGRPGLALTGRQSGGTSPLPAAAAGGEAAAALPSWQGRCRHQPTTANAEMVLWPDLRSGKQAGRLLAAGTDCLVGGFMCSPRHAGVVIRVLDHVLLENVLFV